VSKIKSNQENRLVFIRPFGSFGLFNLIAHNRSLTCTFIGQGLQAGVHERLGMNLPIWRWIFEVTNRRKTYLFLIFFSKYLHLYQWISFSKIILYSLFNTLTLRHKNIAYLHSSENLNKIYIKNSMDVCYFAQPLFHKKRLGYNAQLSKCWRGTWSEKDWELLLYA